MMTALLRELHARGKEAVVLTNTPELFEGLKYHCTYIPSATPVHALSKIYRIEFHSIKYVEAIAGIRAEIPPKQHLIAEMCAHAGLSGEIDIKPEFELSDSEKEMAYKFRDAIIVQSTCLTAKYKMWVKDWGVERMQEVVNRIGNHRRFIQVGSREDPRLDGAEDMRGLPFRQVAAILSQASLFLGLVGFLMHLARAVGTRSVIIYGGRELPWQSGYACNINLSSSVFCAPCWRYDDCPGNKKCMEMITPEQVVESIALALSSPKYRLPTERTTIQSCSFSG